MKTKVGLLNKAHSFYAANKAICLLVLITAVLLLATGIIFKQTWWMMIPLFVSLCVLLLQMKVSRYAFLLGAINCVNYAIVYYCMTLYASAAYSLLFSSPVQLITFLNWRHRSDGKQTRLRQLTLPQTLIGLLLSVILWFIFMFFFGQFGSAYVIIDNTCSVLNIIATILSLLCYVEFAIVSVVSYILTIVMHCMIFLEKPGQATYIVFSVYAAISSIISFVNMRKIYGNQVSGNPSK